MREFSADVKAYKLKGFKVFVLAGEREQSSSIKKLLDSHDIEIDQKDSAQICGDSAILSFGYASGFVLPEEKIAVFGTYDLFPKKMCFLFRKWEIMLFIRFMELVCVKV